MADLGSLSEHVDPIVTILGIALLAVASLAWRTVLEIKKDLRAYLQTQIQCQKELPEKYASWHILTGPEGLLTEIKKDRKDRWRDFDGHKHDPSSGVVIIKP
jgi:hypothetical protein